MGNKTKDVMRVHEVKNSIYEDISEFSFVSFTVWDILCRKVLQYREDKGSLFADINDCYLQGLQPTLILEV